MDQREDTIFLRKESNRKMNKGSSKPSVSNNYIMNLLVNVFTLLVPLITTPYISRALGSESIGMYSYCLLIETDFVVLGTLGIPTYINVHEKILQRSIIY